MKDGIFARSNTLKKSITEGVSKFSRVLEIPETEKNKTCLATMKEKIGPQFDKLKNLISKLEQNDAELEAHWITRRSLRSQEQQEFTYKLVSFDSNVTYYKGEKIKAGLSIMKNLQSYQKCVKAATSA